MKTPTLFATALCALALPIIAVAADDSGFKPLFNGKDTTGWHLRNKDGHNSWTVDNGVLKNTVEKGEHGTDLVTDKSFGILPSDTNTRCQMVRTPASICADATRSRFSGITRRGKPSKSGNGAIYNQTAPSEFASKPGGEWQTCEATIIGHKISVTLNGKKIHDNVECKVGTGSQLDDNVDEPGPIFLQGDHGTVWFRKIEIKELPKE
jgi:hypothetical protein